MISFDYLGHFRGVSLWNLFLNQFLIIKLIRKNVKIFYKFNILVFFFISLVDAKILNLQNIKAIFLIFTY